MLVKRIIPCLDVKDGRVVKGVNFTGLRDAGDPVELAARYEQQGADEIVFLDITASSEARRTMAEVIERTAREVFIPLTVGGGIRSVEDARMILHAGAEKVSVNTAAVRRPELIRELSEEFGAQAVVLAIDAKRAWDRLEQMSAEHRLKPMSRLESLPHEQAWDPLEPMSRLKSLPHEQAGDRLKPMSSLESLPHGWNVYTRGGGDDERMDVIEWARRGAELGAGEILLTSMDTDGVRHGFDCELTRAVSAAVRVPVIASGGAGKPEDFVEVLRECDAALAASIFHYGDYTVGALKQYLAERGVAVRV